MRRRSSIIGILAIAVILAYPAWRYYKHSGYPSSYALVRTGDTEQQVVKKMGSPDKVSQTASFWCNAPGTVQVFLYGDPIPPEWWAVGFNQSGHVSCTALLESP